jgi:hypothetical protein
LALSPEIAIDDVSEGEESPIILKNFRVDLETMRVTNELIEGLEAMKQYIYFVFRIPRYAYSIFSDQIGNEIEELISDNETTVDYKLMELPRLIKEALIYIDFVEDVIEINVEHIDDAFHSTFVVETVEGSLPMEEVFGQNV